MPKPYKHISELPEHIMKEMSHFFSVYKALEGKKTFIESVKDHKCAEEIIASCIAKYQQEFPQYSKK